MVKGGVYDRDNSNTWSGPMTKQEFLKVAAAATLKGVDITLGEDTFEIDGVTLTSLPIGVEGGTDIYRHEHSWARRELESSRCDGGRGRYPVKDVGNGLWLDGWAQRRIRGQMESWCWEGMIRLG